MEARLWITSGIALALFLALGAYAATQPHLPIDLWAAPLRGHHLRLAEIFTTSGRFVPLLLLGLASVGVLALLRLPVWGGLAVLGSQIASQGAVEAIKHFFHRARPDDWFLQHEWGYSYPSGHACTAIVFFGAWLLIALIAPIPRAAKIVSAAVLALWMIGIDWSRLALGAHFLSDVIGGTLFGISWLSALLALLVHFGVPDRAFAKVRVAS